MFDTVTTRLKKRLSEIDPSSMSPGITGYTRLDMKLLFVSLRGCVR